MNANELAEIIQHLENARYTGASKAATMLRQQQEQIDKLTAIVALRELKIERMVEDRSKYEAMAHVGGVEAGKKLAQAEIDLLKADMRLLLREYHQYWKEKNDSI